MAHTSTELNIPYLSVGDLGWQLMRLGVQQYDAKRNELVDRVFANCDVDPESVPEAWNGAPLTRWCWLVLTVNDLEPDPLVQKPLIHWGIDLGFAGEDLRNFIWAVS